MCRVEDRKYLVVQNQEAGELDRRGLPLYLAGRTKIDLKSLG
jgi:hypothetical protein